jgi:hypothetical protein
VKRNDQQLKGEYMRVNRGFAKIALAAAVSIGVIAPVALIGGTAVAKKAPAASITCTGITATVTFTPPLVPTTSSAGYSKTDQTTITNDNLSGCTTTNSTAKVTGGSGSATVAPSKAGNTCSGFGAAAAKTKLSFSYTWNNGGGTSTASFKGSTQNTSPPGFVLSKGKVTGAFASKAGSVQANLTSASTATFAACEGGSGDVSSLTISGGSATL